MQVDEKLVLGDWHAKCKNQLNDRCRLYWAEQSWPQPEYAKSFKYSSCPWYRQYTNSCRLWLAAFCKQSGRKIGRGLRVNLRGPCHTAWLEIPYGNLPIIPTHCTILSIELHASANVFGKHLPCHWIQDGSSRKFLNDKKTSYLKGRD